MKESPLLEVFIHASFFFAVAALLIPLLKKYKIPSVLGYLAAGIIFGPQALGELSDKFPFLEYVTLQNSDHIKILAELGIVFLLFVIGLEITPKKLWQMRNLVFGLGTAQVLLSSIAIGLIAYSWGNSVEASILLGLGLSLSSTAIIIQWLHEKKLFNTQAGQTSFGILLFQDLAVIPILLLITIFGADLDGEITYFVSTLVGKMILAVLAIVIIGKWFIRPLFSFSNKYGGSEVFISLSFLVIIVSASIAGLSGLSLALGAFIGGLLLAETQYSHEISSIIVPFKGMLMGIFFMAFGMSIDIAFITEKPVLLLGAVIGLMTIKFFITYALCRLWKVQKPAALETALLLPQAGEFGLLVVGSSLAIGILDNFVGQFMFLTIGATMILTPIITPLSQRLGVYLQNKHIHLGNNLEKAPDELMSEHVVIMGYGRMGKIVSEILAREGIRTIAFDKNIDRLNEAKKNDRPVYYGDVTKKSTLKAAQIENASSVVITIYNPAETRKIYHSIRELYNDIPITIRAHKLSDLPNLQNEDNVHIVPEYLSASLIIASKALEYSGYSQEEAQIIVQEKD